MTTDLVLDASVRALRGAGWYKRMQATLLSRGATPYDRLVHARKQALLPPLRGTIIELGPGAGPNLRYLARGVHWIGIEPNPYVHDELRASAARSGLAGEVRTGAAEELPIDNATADAVVCTLVLCSVRDQEAALREIRRVLRPGGTFVFVEHVAARGGWRRFAQRALQPVWRVLGDGCHPARDTAAAIRRAGFAQIDCEEFEVPIALIGPHIAGVATR